MSGTTANYAFPYPDETDAADPTADIKALADAVDTEVHTATSPSAASYTPTVTGGGTATFTTRSGWYFQTGKIVFVNLYVLVLAAGSGSAVVQLSLPVAADTSIDQILPAHGQSLKGTSSSVNGLATINTSGGASILTKITVSSNTAPTTTPT